MLFPMTLRLLRLLPALAISVGLLACATAPTDQPADSVDSSASATIASSPWATQSILPSSPGESGWTHRLFPGKKPTSFSYARHDGRHAVAVHAESSASMLHHRLRVEPDRLGDFAFSWKVPALMAEADLAQRDKADAAVRVVLMFEGDRSRLSVRDAALSELARGLTGEEMPYATLMYVWSGQRPAGTVIPSTRTSRIRKLVVESGPGRLGDWLDYRRDIRRDFEQAFGEPPGALVGIGIMTDSDNTGSRVRAWYGPLRMVAAPGR